MEPSSGCSELLVDVCWSPIAGRDLVSVLFGLADFLFEDLRGIGGPEPFRVC